MIKLENWSVGDQTATRYTAPEAMRPSLEGNVYGHPKFTDGERIHTSPITSVDGSVVQTEQNSYVLGEPHEEYVKWCRASKVHVPTKDEPILWGPSPNP